MPKPHTPSAVIVTNPLPPGRMILATSVTVTPSAMEVLVGEPPRYDRTNPRDHEVAKWIDWSARRTMADEIRDLTDKKAREAAESSG